MSWLPWSEKGRSRRLLSDYLDGQLSARDRDQVEEEITLNAAARNRLDAYSRVTELVGAATAPPRMPDAVAFADRLMARVVDRETAVETVARRPSRSRLSPAVLASIGLLITAGVTLVGLRRRGIL
jgi:anti-sigma factor RsiW